MKKNLVAMIAVLSLLEGCKNQKSLVNYGAYILGPQNDIIQIKNENVANIPKEVLDASVIIVTKVAGGQIKFCSGTLIEPKEPSGKNRILTNHHCFAELGADKKALPTLLKEACTETKVYFGFLAEQAKQALSVGCEPFSLRTSYEGDLAVFTVSGAEPAGIKPLKLAMNSRTPDNKQALIVHYPDQPGMHDTLPGRDAKLPTAQATLNDCKIISDFTPGEWTLDRVLPFSFKHSCDLTHGSSGSAIVDRDTLEILGVNWGGIKIVYDDGEKAFNAATKISFVKAFLDDKSQDIIAQASRELQSSLDAERGGKTVSNTEQSDGTKPPKELKKLGCGVIAMSSSAGSKLIFWLPIGIFALRSRRALLASLLLLLGSSANAETTSVKPSAEPPLPPPVEIKPSVKPKARSKPKESGATKRYEACLEKMVDAKSDDKDYMKRCLEESEKKELAPKPSK